MTTLTSLPILEQHTTRDPAGWYPDPWYPDPIGSASWLRYWDGFDWTARTALTVIGEDAQPASASPPADTAPPSPPTDTAPPSPAMAESPTGLAAHAEAPVETATATHDWT